MEASLSYRAWADAVLVFHFAIIVFVVGGLPAIIFGNLAGQRWINRPGFRVAHLAAIVVIVLQSWLGQTCGLTELESWLRLQAGQAPYTQTFVEHWLQRILYHQAPAWVFTLAYTVFGLLVGWAWWKYPPTRGR